MVLDRMLGLVPRAATDIMRAPHDDVWYGLPGGATIAGVNVTEENSLAFTDVFACVNKLAKTKATLPVQVFERPPGTKESVPVDDPLNEILSVRANANSTGITLRESLMANAMLWGNAYAEKVIDERGRIRELHVLPSRSVTVSVNGNGVWTYHFHPDGVGGTRDIPADRVLHIPGLSLNGAVGLSVIGLNRAAIGLGEAMVEFGSAYFGNGAWAGGFITGAPNSTGKNGLTAEAGQGMIDSINQKLRGPREAFGFAMLRGDMDIKQLEMPFEDAMFLGTRQFQKVQICSMFDVPLSKIQDLTGATFSNVEQQDLGWAKDSILPWCVRWEMAINHSFFQGTNRFIKFNIDGLLRGDLLSRMQAITLAIQWGLLQINEGRELLERQPLDGGDISFVPMNMDILGEPRTSTATAPPALPAPADNEDENAKLAESFLPMITEAVERLGVKEDKALTSAVSKYGKTNNASGFIEWADSFYGGQSRFADAIFLPIVSSFCAASGQSVDQSSVTISNVSALVINYVSGCRAIIGHPEEVTIFDNVATIPPAELREDILQAFSQSKGSTHE